MPRSADTGQASSLAADDIVSQAETSAPATVEVPANSGAPETSAKPVAVKVRAKLTLAKAPAKPLAVEAPARPVTAKALAKPVTFDAPAKWMATDMPAKPVTVEIPAKPVMEAPAGSVVGEVPAEPVAVEAPIELMATEPAAKLERSTKRAPRRSVKRTKPVKPRLTIAADSAPVKSRAPAANDLSDIGPKTDTRFRPSPHSLANRLCRGLWGIAWLVLFRPSPKPLHRWRRALLRLFGARIGEGVVVHPSARIWGPWNLEMGDHSCLSPHVDCYSVNSVRIGSYATVSQYSFLCTASHDLDHPDMPLTTAPIAIGNHAWVAADVFVAPGIIVGEGAVVGARSTVLRNVAPWTVVAGNPLRTLRKRPRTAAGGVSRG